MDNHPFHDVTAQQAILSKGTREDLIRWLVWNDQNGTYTDTHSDTEGLPRLTLDAARQLMADILARG